MNTALSHQWNQTVGENDTVYILGDWCFYGPNNVQKVADHMNSLNGMKKFVFGNHDHKGMIRKLVKDGLVPKLEILGDRAEIKSFDSKGNKYDITLCHYAHRTWNKSHYGSMMLYGHSHGTLPGLGRSMDVGVDVKHRLYGDWAPFSIDQIIDQIGNIPIHNPV
ncbi:metallo-dependent phosphatase-like protein [Vibrio phage 2.275.O._10N.286.54.E11]|nr:metallo-dependent phosphatase-like protein [Vibrio phage 2.275.O._10N.286.54.E11]